MKKHHTTGLVWNSKGGSATDLVEPLKPKAAVISHKTHVDSPRPPDHLHARPHVASIGSALAKADLTAGLRKVDKSEMTHKNPELRGSSIVPAVAEKGIVPAKVFGSPVVKKSPVTRLDGNKWMIVSG